MSDALLTPGEAAVHLRRSRKTLDNWRSAGHGPKYVKLGRGRGARIYYRERDIADYIRRHVVTPGDEEAPENDVIPLRRAS